jgi:hypothetical protein
LLPVLSPVRYNAQNEQAFTLADLFGADAAYLLSLTLSLRNSRHPSRMRLTIWIVGLTALANSLDSACGRFYGRAIARMLPDMTHGSGLG